MRGVAAALLFFFLFFSFLEAAQFEKSKLNYSFGIETIKTKIYDFSTNASIDRWAYRKNVAEQPPPAGAPSREFNSRQYGRIAYNDDIYQVDDARRNRYAAHRFVFTIHENRSRITNLKIFWKGAGIYRLYFFGSYINLTSGSGFKLYLWNYSSFSYDEIFNTTSFNVFNVSENVSLDYLGSNGEIACVVEQNSATANFGFISLYSTIETDYVYVEVKYV